MTIALGSLLAASAAAAEPKYVGVQDCARCHKKEMIGDQYGVWKKSKHANAMDALKSDKAKKIAAEKGLADPPDQAKECVRCHATAAALKPSEIYKKPLKISDGVQCESCHGPGSEYRKKTGHATSIEKGIAAGMWEPGKNEKVCTNCHNSDSPSWDPAKGFDFEAHKKKIEHPIPEKVKGHVLELEEAARKGD
jgi:Cytochrome c554 and c-prime